ncbi:MAG TPA: hypothetical protein VNX25_07980 [Verrucomicrobiae bacterium]|nr:hypothetical protein [Verrucomicrobiae bacterium]
MNANFEVITYGGYRGDETPRAFVRDGNRVEVVKILDQWTEEDVATREHRRCFVVKGSDSRTHTLCYVEEREEWVDTQ